MHNPGDHTHTALTPEPPGRGRGTSGRVGKGFRSHGAPRCAAPSLRARLRGPCPLTGLSKPWTLKAVFAVRGSRGKGLWPVDGLPPLDPADGGDGPSGGLGAQAAGLGAQIAPATPPLLRVPPPTPLGLCLSQTGFHLKPSHFEKNPAEPWRCSWPASAHLPLSLILRQRGAFPGQAARSPRAHVCARAALWAPLTLEGSGPTWPAAKLLADAPSPSKGLEQAGLQEGGPQLPLHLAGRSYDSELQPDPRGHFIKGGVTPEGLSRNLLR